MRMRSKDLKKPFESGKTSFGPLRASPSSGRAPTTSKWESRNLRFISQSDRST
ncbi:MAG: hypothetical protein KJ653_09175 [Candidatus Thermoplasmatota archaeon]|nr:hypothetical protein [Candidatus Thermoplasmatota archaeon]